MELPCPFAGTIETLHVKTGDAVQVGQVLFTVVTQGADVRAPAAKVAAPAPPRPAASQPQAVKSAPRKVEAELVTPPRSEATKGQTAVAAAAPGFPQALYDQLTPGGRLVVPVGGRRGQRLEVIVRSPEGPAVLKSVPCRFVPLVGEEGFRE